jgi:hypothetical protein
MPTPRVVTLSSDLGPVYAAQMKGVLLRSLPPGSVVDLTHDLPAHRVTEGAFVLRHMVAPFPPRSVHVAVVDPGVGGPRAPIAIACRSGAILVGPDNGLLNPAREALGGGSAFRIDPRRVAPQTSPSATFEGRDVFAPAAAFLATGGRPSALGTAWTPKRFVLPEARRTGGGIVGELLHIDRFGNGISNIPTVWLPPPEGRLTVTVGGRPAHSTRWVRTYADLALAESGLLGSSFGTVEVCVREGRASERFRAAVGDRVRISLGRAARSARKTVNRKVGTTA